MRYCNGNFSPLCIFFSFITPNYLIFQFTINSIFTTRGMLFVIRLFAMLEESKCYICYWSTNIEETLNKNIPREKCVVCCETLNKKTNKR